MSTKMTSAIFLLAQEKLWELIEVFIPDEEEREGKL